MNTPDDIPDEQCHVCGGRIGEHEGVCDDGTGEDFDAAYYHQACA